RPIDRTGAVANVVDHIMLAPLKYGGRERNSGELPAYAGFVPPGLFRTEIGISDVSRIGIVKIGVGRQAVGVGQGCAQPQVLGDCVTSTYGRAEDGVARGKRLLPAAEGKRETADGAGVQIQIGGAALARVPAQVIAVDAVAKELSAIEQAVVVAQPGALAHGRLPALGGVVVFVDRRLIAQQDKFVGMPAVGKLHIGVPTELLLGGRKPSFGALPGIEVSIELVGPERAVAQSEKQGAVAPGTRNACPGSGGKVPVIPVGRES